MESAVREIVYFAAGAAEGVDPMDVDPDAPGDGRARSRTTPASRSRCSERMRPLLAFFVLMMESLALAGARSPSRSSGAR